MLNKRSPSKCWRGNISDIISINIMGFVPFLLGNGVEEGECTSMNASYCRLAGIALSGSVWAHLIVSRSKSHGFVRIPFIPHTLEQAASRLWADIRRISHTKLYWLRITDSTFKLLSKHMLARFVSMTADGITHWLTLKLTRILPQVLTLPW